MLDETTTGRALQRLRELSGMSERAAARAIGVHRSVLRSWESHRSLPDSDQITRALTAYGHDLGDVIVPRTPLVDPARPGVLVVGDEEIVVAEHHGSGTDAHEANTALLRSYLAAVRRQRGVPDGHPVELRTEDLTSLAVELDLGDDQLQALLGDLLDLTPAGAQFTARALLVGALVAMVASGVVQGSWLGASASASTTLVPTSVQEQVIDAPPTFWAGDIGPTVRGPAFAVDRDAPLAPYAEVTPDATPYTIFSVDPVERTGDAADDILDGTDLVVETDPADTGALADVDASASDAPSLEADPTVFSVTPRGVPSATISPTARRSGAAEDSRPALPPGSPALPPAD